MRRNPPLIWSPQDVQDTVDVVFFDVEVDVLGRWHVVLVGDAAHSIHPLAGQGINLGFADADALCEEIISSYEKSMHIDQALTLKRYEIRRKNMNLLMLKSMDFFVNLFGSKNLYIKLLRNFGLSGVNKTQFLKKFFINHASGKNKI